MVFSVVIELLIFTREGRGNEGCDSSYIHSLKEYYSQSCPKRGNYSLRKGGVTRGVTAHIYTQLKGILQPSCPKRAKYSLWRAG
jgi:hypothetical protein